jgi:hypothetical protein
MPKLEKPKMKPRIHAELFQLYLHWRDTMRMSVRTQNRISAIERGDSNLNPVREKAFADAIGSMVDGLKKNLILEAENSTGPIFEWLTSFKGLKEGSLAAQLIAQIDNIGKFSNISKLWRFSGYAVIDGHREYNKEGEPSHYNKVLKSTVYLIMEQFLRQQTPEYISIYYDEKERLTAKYPEYTKMHLHRMAMRKMAKIFLSHVWLVWSKAEGLPITQPWIIAVGGHADMIEPDTM